MTEHERDERVTQAYRALGDETPPASLDVAILAAARRRGGRWYLPVASAAVLVLAVAVAVVVEREAPKEEVPVAAAPPAPAPAPRAARRAEAEKPADRVVPEAKQDRRDDLAKAEPAPEDRTRVEITRRLERQDVVVGASAPAESPAPDQLALRPSSPASTAGVRGTELQESQQPAPAMSAPSALAGAMSGKRAAADEATQAPEKWLERIARLREAGRTKEADDALAEFRKRYPDYEIPKEMRERVLPR